MILTNPPVLPYEDAGFDHAVCSLSVEYLTHPVTVFKEVARVLKPGGRFIVSFSNRWFPEKSISLWENLHEFERVGLVMAFFDSAGCFKDLETRSVRGYPRPLTIHTSIKPSCLIRSMSLPGL
ncbi:class I SAM-dependent methyltransferase [uncultured Desulfobacter sp.]|uniref:class I SAM-dependent methyltransferase n=1 Tax=uncultured Desulfobacter sp. TaxID=240139 RepID=UPI0029F4EE4E|nr:class I SAM-dependent methyltransferase [uncultured Desulfobacter sp.]